MKNKIFKKSISLVLTVLMVMSSWVFFPGMIPEVSAVSDDVAPVTTYATYHVKLKADFDNAGKGGSIEILYYPVKSDGSLDTANTGSYTLVNSIAYYNSQDEFVFDTQDNSTRALASDGSFYTGGYDEKAETGPVQGWPYAVRLKANGSGVVYLRQMWINGKEVLESGQWSITGGKTKVVNYNSENLDYKDNWKVPEATSFSTPANITITAPEIGSGKTVTATTGATLYDQYGVKMPVSGGLSYDWEVVTGTGASGFVGFEPSGSNGVVNLKLTVDEQVNQNLSENSTDGKLVYNVWPTYNGNYLNLAKATVTVNCPKYNVYYKNAAGTIVYTQSIGFYNNVKSTLANPVANTPVKSNGGGVNDTHTVYTWPAAETYTITGHKTINEIVTTSAHSWNAGVVNPDSTCTTKGTKTYTCTVCGQTRTEEVGIKAHNLTETAAKSATCTEDGNINYWYCSTCNQYFSDAAATKVITLADTVLTAPGHTYESVVTAPTCTSKGYTTHTCSKCGDSYVDTYVDATTHSFTVFVETIEPTCTAQGYTTYKCASCNVTENRDYTAARHKLVQVEKQDATCTEPGWEAYEYCEVCDYTTKVAIPAPGHTEEILPAVDATCTTPGKTEGKKCSVCGEILVAQTETPKLAHSMGDWITDKEPTCITAGSKHKKCANCDYTETEAIAATGVHVYGEWTNYTATEHSGKCTNDPACTATITEAHTISDTVKKFDATYHYYKCEKCDAYGALFNGTFSTSMKEACYGEGTTFTQIADNATQHTETCKCGSTKTDAHAYGSWTADPENKADDKGQMSRTCSECSYKQTTSCNYKATETVKATCTEDGHITWKCSDCGNGYTEILKATGHTNGEAVTENNVPATCTTDGSYDSVVYCTVCNAELDRETITVDALGHTFGETVTANAATCVATGNEAYKQCTVCNKYFAADEGAMSTDAKDSADAFKTEIDEKNHKNTTNHDEITATCLGVGYTAGVFCEDCDKWISGHEEIPAIAHKNKVHHEKVDATCVATGTIEYWSCPDCGKNFSDEDCTIEATKLTIEINPDNHDLKTTAAKAPTCEDFGWDEYVTCKREGCGYTTYVEKQATGHDYGEWAYDADGNHKRVCANDAKHIETEACSDSATDNDCNCDKCLNLVAHSYGDATCNAPATCTVCGATTGGVLGHDWSAVTYSFVEDGSACTAIRECCREGCDEAETATATITSAVKTPATCTEKGTTTYTATFTEAWADTQTLDVVDIPAKDHNWSVTYSFAADGSTCTASRVCKNDASHVENATATITSAVKTPATCTEMGTTTYTATFSVDWAETKTKDVKDIAIDSTNHINQTSHEETAATCLKVGYTAGVFCEDCDKWISGHAEIPAIAHKNKVHHAENPATCVATGTIEYWSCPDCRKNFSDEACTTEVTDLIIGIDAKNHTKLVKTDAVKATCEKEGNIDYWTCEGCGKIYSDADANTEIAAKETVIAAKGHDYDTTKSEANLTRPELVDGTWTKGYYTYTCKNDSSHTTVEEVDRAAYTAYEAALDNLKSLLDTDITDEARDAINKAIEDNKVADNLITSEQSTIDAATTALVKAFEDNNNSLNTYTVTFKIYGSADVVVTVISGNDATAPTDVKKAYDDTHHYEFDKWDSDFTNVTSDITVTATFDAIEHTYTHTDKDDTYHTDSCTCGYSKDVKHTETSEVTTKASCFADGIRTYTCSVCSGTRTETIAKRTHNIVDTTVATAPTCSATGIMNQKCDCAETAEYEACDYTTTRVMEKVADAHKWETEYTVDKKASCDEAGSKSYHCEYCDTINADSVTEIAKREHNLVDTTVALAPTCSATGIMNQKCNCAETAEYEACDYTTTRVMDKVADAHKWETEYTVDKKASCDEAGSKSYHCEYCDEINADSVVEIAKREHNLVDTTVATAPTCSATGIMNQKCDHTGSDEYEACGYTTTRVMDKVADAHKAEADYTVMQKATCEADGYKAILCEYCDAELSKETIAKRAHVYVDNGVKTAATCKAEGVMNTICSNAETDTHEACTHESTRVIPVDPGAHKAEAEYIQTIAPTCSAVGEEKLYCEYCDAVLDTREVAIEKDAHKAEAKYIQTIAPTCSAVGEEKLYCEYCDAVLDTREVAIEKDAHTGAANVIKNEKEATCLENGYTGDIHWSCCDALETKGKEILALGHTEATREENRVEPSCGTAGSYDLVTYCTVCTQVIKTEKVSIPATGEHNFVTEVDGTRVPSTCKTPGSVTMKCGCGATEVQTIPVDENNHEDIVTDEAVAPTCTKSGLTEGSHCAACDKVIIKQEEIPALGHKEDKDASIYIAPSCDKNGYVKRVCGVCGEIFGSSTIAPTGHKYTDETGAENFVIVPATCDAKGSKYLVCTVCGYENTKDAIPYGTPSGHYLFIKEGYAPTCTEDGLTEYVYCLREGCDYEVHAKKIPATGHKDNGDGMCSSCGNKLYESGSKSCGCLCHKDSVIMRFIYKIVLFFWKLFRIKHDCGCGSIHY